VFLAPRFRVYDRKIFEGVALKKNFSLAPSVVASSNSGGPEKKKGKEKDDGARQAIHFEDSRSDKLQCNGIEFSPEGGIFSLQALPLQVQHKKSDKKNHTLSQLKGV